MLQLPSTLYAEHCALHSNWTQTSYVCLGRGASVLRGCSRCRVETIFTIHSTRAALSVRSPDRNMWTLQILILNQTLTEIIWLIIFVMLFCSIEKMNLYNCLSCWVYEDLSLRRSLSTKITYYLEDSISVDEQHWQWSIFWINWTSKHLQEKKYNRLELQLPFIVLCVYH